MDISARVGANQWLTANWMLLTTPAVFVLVWSHVAMLPLAIVWLYSVQRTESVRAASLAGVLWILTLLLLGLSQLPNFDRASGSNSGFLWHAIGMVALYGVSFALASWARRFGVATFAFAWCVALSLPALPLLLDYSMAAPLLALLGVGAFAGDAALVCALTIVASTATAAYSARLRSSIFVGVLSAFIALLIGATHRSTLVTDQLWRTDHRGQLSAQSFIDQATIKVASGEKIVVPPEAALGAYRPELEEQLDQLSVRLPVTTHVVFAPLHLPGVLVGTKNAAIALGRPQAGVVSAIGVVPGGNAAGDFRSRNRLVSTEEGSIMPLFCAEEWSLAPLYRPSEELRAIAVFTNHYWDRTGWLSSLQRTGSAVWAGIFKQPVVRGVAFL